MKVLVASMGRTGSVLMTQIVKDAFQTKGISAVVSHEHFFNKKLVDTHDIVISTKRDIREMMASTKRFLSKLGEDYYSRKSDGTHNNIVEECESQINIYNSWLPYTEKIFTYEDYQKNPKEYIKSVFDFFNIEYTDDSINHLVQKYKNPIRTKHITNPNGSTTYKDTLTNDEIKDINTLFDDKYSDIKNIFIYNTN